MSQGSLNVNEAAGGEFVIQHMTNAPRSLVFKAWTEAERMAQWWGPKGMKVAIHRMELKPGGVLHYSMKTPDGKEMFGKFVYLDIQSPERIVFDVSFCDKNGTPIRHPLSASWPLEVQSTITFTELNGRTQLTMSATPVRASEQEHKTFREGHAGMRQGWAGTLGQLDEYLIAAGSK